MSTGTVYDPRSQTEVDPGVAFWAQPGAPASGNNRGTWNAAAAYNVNDIVHRKPKTYVCILANTNKDPATQPTYWTWLAV